MDKDIKKELEESYIKNQLMRKQLNDMISEKSMLEAEIEKITQTLDAIEELEKLEKGDNVWASLGSGVFVSVNIKNLNELFVRLDSKVIKKKTITSTKELLENRINKIKDVIKNLDYQIDLYVNEIRKIESRIQDLAKNTGLYISDIES